MKKALPVTKASNNLGEKPMEIANMAFRVPKDFKRRFKQKALEEDVSLTELFLRSFNTYYTE